MLLTLLKNNTLIHLPWSTYIDYYLRNTHSTNSNTADETTQQRSLGVANFTGVESNGVFRYFVSGHWMLTASLRPKS